MDRLLQIFSRLKFFLLPHEMRQESRAFLHEPLLKTLLNLLIVSFLNGLNRIFSFFTEIIFPVQGYQ
jgi:uncharacterized metal-binding protein